jgi:hypothetical protein
VSDENVVKDGKKADKDARVAKPAQAINSDPDPGPTCPVLLNPSEWDDPPECTTISEFHKGETTAGIGPDAEDPDLEAWLDHWKLRQSQKVMSEYHQEGAPYLEELPGPTKPIEPEPEEQPVVEKPKVKIVKKVPIINGEPEDDIRPPLRTPTFHESHIEPESQVPGPRYEPKQPPRAVKPQTTPMQIKTQELIPSPYAAPPYEPKAPKSKHKGPRMPSETDVKQRLERVLDVRTLEFLAYTVIRTVLPRRVRYSVKKEGIVDMDIVLFDRDVILNTNKLEFEVPELAIWRIVYAYKGKPVIEYGRGVKNNIKIYKWRLVRILVGLWWSKRFGKARREAKEEEKQDEELEEEVDLVAVHNAKKAAKRLRAKERLRKSTAKISSEEE